MRIKTETYLQRRDRLKKDMGSGLLLFLGNAEVGMNYADNTYKFRQDSTFLYFIGMDDPTSPPSSTWTRTGSSSSATS